MTGDVGETFNDWRSFNKAIRAMYGVGCPRCKEVRPKAHPSILLPQQRCKVDKYIDPRPRLTEEQKQFAANQQGAPFFKKVESK